MPKNNNPNLLFRKLFISWHKAFLRFASLGGFSSHNRIQIFHDGDEAFAAIFLAIEKATHSIYVETYLLASDNVGLKLRDALLKSAKEGVTITIIYDHIGSTGLGSAYFRPLIAAGIKILPFNPIWPWRKRGPLLFRDHRKIIVIDHQIAFCGSMNMSADYAGPLFGTNRFRDTVALIEGPAVKDLLAITLESIREAELAYEAKLPSDDILNGKNLKSSIKLFFRRLLPKKTAQDAHLSYHDGTLIQVLRSNMRLELAHIQKSMEEAVNHAVSYCYFTTPYFLPHEGLRRALRNAAHRGVDVRILTAGLSDFPMMRYASRHVYGSFLKRHIRIYEMTKKTLHAKLATIDGVYSLLGSYNLDHWSARRNLEVNLAIIDQDIALELKSQFQKDLELSQEINEGEFQRRSFFRRFLCWVAYLVMRL
jgi:cardiolipin synthase A/B